MDRMRGSDHMDGTSLVLAASGDAMEEADGGRLLFNERLD